MRTFSAIFTFFLALQSFAASPADLGITAPNNSITTEAFTFVGLLTRIESILLYGITPVVIIGAGLYIAYELFTADGNEEKNKKAWKSLTYGAIGLVCIALAYGAVSIILSLSI